MRMQRLHEKTPVLILTGATVLEEDQEAAIRRNAAYVFYKPQRYDALIEYLQRLTDALEG